jgi:hypothetical protein
LKVAKNISSRDAHCVKSFLGNVAIAGFVTLWPITALMCRTVDLDGEA